MGSLSRFISITKAVAYLQNCNSKQLLPTIWNKEAFQFCFLYISRFSNVTKSFEDARRSCESNGGMLFEPRNKEENKEVADAGYEIVGNAYYWWIGVDDKEREGRFQYSSNKQEINFSNWGSGQPNNLNSNEDCVVMITSFDSFYSGKWADYHCSSENKFICEFT